MNLHLHVFMIKPSYEFDINQMKDTNYGIKIIFF